MTETSSWGTLQNFVRDSGYDAALVNSYQAVSFFAGTNLLSQMMLPDRLAMLLVTTGGPSLVVCNIEAGQARAQSAVPQMVEYVEFVEQPEQALARELNRLGLSRGRLAIEARRMPVHTRDALIALLPELQLVECDEQIESLQTIKRPDTISRLAYAGRATQEAIEAAAAASLPGATELDLSSAVISNLSRAGATPTFCFLSSGTRALQGHPEATDQRMTHGDLWRVDVGGRLDDGVLSDVGRCGVVGAASPEQEDMFAILAAAQAAAIAAIEPGRPAGDVHRATRDSFLAAGIDWNVPHVGHGIGIGVHEHPILAPSNQSVLKPGMVLCVEPFLMLFDRGQAFHTEDLIEVTESGTRLLTTPQTELLRVP